MGLSDKMARFQQHGRHAYGRCSRRIPPASYNEFERLNQFVKLQQPPPVKFKDLEAHINTRVTYNILPMQVRIDYVRVTEASVMANITVQFENKRSAVPGEGRRAESERQPARRASAT